METTEGTCGRGGGGFGGRMFEGMEKDAYVQGGRTLDGWVSSRCAHDHEPSIGSTINPYIHPYIHTGSLRDLIPLRPQPSIVHLPP